jgi:hypothetical protein
MASDRRRLAAGVAAAIALAIAAGAELDLAAPVSRDTSFYLYFAQASADGAVLYRDVYETKTPLAVLVAAIGVELADAAGVAPVALLRVAFLGCALATWIGLACYATRSAGQPARVALPVIAAIAWQLPLGLPATGVVPKTLQIACAAAMLPAIGARAWLAAGLLASLGFWDWQVGGLALPAAFAAALIVDRRAAALARVAAGFALGVAAVFAVFATWDASVALWRTAIANAAASESAGALGPSFGERWLRVVRVAHEAAGPAALPLAAAHLAGIGVCARLALRLRDPVAAFAACYASALGAMALVELDGVGDLFPYAAAGVIAQFAAVSRSGPGRELSPLQRAFALAALLCVLGLGPGAGEEAPAFSLADQQRLAQRLFARVDPGRVASIGYPELHLLVRERAAGRFVYFSDNAYRALRRDGEDWAAALSRELREADAEAAIVGRSNSWDAKRPFERVRSADGSAYRRGTLAADALCYELLVRSGSELLAELSPDVECPP